MANGLLTASLALIFRFGVIRATMIKAWPGTYTVAICGQKDTRDGEWHTGIPRPSPEAYSLNVS